jgi:hypothetical protein
MSFLNVLFTRTAILLYISLAANVALYNGLLVDKEKLKVTVSPEIVTAYQQYKEDNANVEAVAEYQNPNKKVKPVAIEEE